ncbi:hypothetical protein G5C60_09385 [Streptomyces sp. HC44]|uniref:Carrier domain-containing protein n=1 Tax=Streptomyces scabichelini TaxID=2711217 RepID=A0A6G4V1D4_9ACTN|nr:phosphopantetheine-binding protein [Streptomyces scabichelini]NGO07858.1 hypothetical protein [Streptomyces scabichelini]
MPFQPEEVRETVLGIIQQLAPEPERFDSAKDLNLVNDLGFHSLALLELAFAIEDDFDLPPIDEETGRGIQTTEQVLEYVLGQLAEQDELVSP